MAEENMSNAVRRAHEAADNLAVHVSDLVPERNRRTFETLVLGLETAIDAIPVRGHARNCLCHPDAKNGEPITDEMRRHCAMAAITEPYHKHPHHDPRCAASPGLDLGSLKAARQKYLRLGREIGKVAEMGARSNLLHTHSKLGIFLATALGGKWKSALEEGGKDAK